MNVAYLITRWYNVRASLRDLIGRFQTAELDFRPYPTAWSVRELMLHIAQEEHGEFAYGIVQTLTEFPPAYAPAAYPTVEAIQALLEDVHQRTLAYLGTLRTEDLEREVVTPWAARYRLMEMLDHLVEHEIHHRAELSLILGMLGHEGLNA